MKQLFTICMVALIYANAFTQQSQFFNQSMGSVVNLNPQSQQFDFMPGEILVRFQDDASIGNLKQAGIAQTGVISVDQIFIKYKVSENKRLFPNEKRLLSPVVLTVYNGKEFEQPSLHNIYKLKVHEPNKIFEAIEELKQDPNIIYAEPNYIFSMTNDDPVSPVLKEMDLQSASFSIFHSQFSIPSCSPVPSNAPSPATPDDPLYSQQYYITAIHANEVWDSVNGKDSTQVIGVLDTGVDWLHPDLSPNIWINQDEVPGNGVDDDGNGYVDDLRGWDWINNDPNPMDDAGHGTHVAGIAAARGNNGIGITGISPRAKIMSLKILSHAGFGDAATISQGIIYAYSNGATILNMSFGSYARSATMENALLTASLTSDLVAAAGNDTKNINSTPGTFYPAAFSFVLGVQANTDFSNYDPDGPIFSEFQDGFNYELTAPGSGLLSTFRNGTYKGMSGTSMAAPCVAGAVSLYKSFFPAKSREELWSDLIYTSSVVINLQQAMFNVIKYPVFDLMESHIIDTLPGADRDGQADAGETIQLWVKIRNTFGPADSAYVKIQQTNYGDTNDVQIVIDSSYLGSMATYATLTNQYIPFQVFIKPDAANERTITLNVLMKNKGDTADYVRPVSFKIYNGTELSGLITQNTTLTPDKLWLVNSNLRIGTGVTMTILPGTHIHINAGVDNRGNVNAIGTADSLIYIKGVFGGSCQFKYVEMDLGGKDLTVGGDIEHCEIYNGKSLIAGKIKYCYIHDLTVFSVMWSPITIHGDSIINSYIKNISYNNGFYGKMNQSTVDGLIFFDSFGGISKSKYSVYTKIMNMYKYLQPNNPSNWYANPACLLYENGSGLNETDFLKNSFLTNDIASYFVRPGLSGDAMDFRNQYWGTTDTLKIRPKYYDFWNNVSLPFLNYKPFLNAPSDSCPGHVWRILVNGHDAQDEVPEPIGVGNVHFAVCFNKAMDTTQTPKLTFGLRTPYNQNVVDDSTHWSADHKTWYATYNVKLYTGDGLNRIKVDSARAPGEFPIPTEDQRFNILIQAAGSSSVNFMAQAGIGKVYLEWNNSGIPDLLGFNIYRFNNITDTTYTQPVMINTTLVTDTTYTDFSVTPGTRYWYYYKVLNTDFRESDSSNIVNATPYNSPLGDANGDSLVNVLDITAIISYMLSQNPQPFLFDAADVNSDNIINILDVIGVVDIIIGKKKELVTNIPPAYIYLEDGSILLKTTQPVAGLQFELEGEDLDDLELALKLPEFELATCLINGRLLGVIYSYSNKVLPLGLQNIIQISGIKGPLRWGDLLAGDPHGNPVKVIPDKLNTYPLDECNMTVYPNPFNQSTHIQYRLFEASDVVIGVYDLFGKLLTTIFSGNQTQGEFVQTWDGFTPGNDKKTAGIYIIRFTANGESGKTVKKYAKVVMIK